MMRSKILFVSYTADWTGPTNSLSLLIHDLRRQFDVGVLLPGAGLFTERLTAEKVRFHALPSLGIRSVIDIAQIIRREGYHLVYGNTTHGSSRNAFLASAIARRPFAVHIREMGWHKTWRQMAFIRFCRRVIAVSHACAASFQRFAGRRSIDVVHNGVPLGWQVPERSAARAELAALLNRAESAQFIVSVSHLCERKGQLYQIEAFEKLAGRLPSAELVLIGSLDREPEYVAKIRARLESSRISSRVHLLGFRTDVTQLLAGADLFLHSAVADPHPRSVIEAMATGLPVVAFATDGVSETVANESTGLLVPPHAPGKMASAVCRILTDDSVARRFSEAGRERAVTRFNSQTTSLTIGNIISQVVS